MVAWLQRVFQINCDRLTMIEKKKNESSKYGIINYKMLVDLAIKQAPKALEAARLFREDGVKLEEVKELRMEFLNIISLEHLWPMKNIRKLTLSHNCIEKIEKLDNLIELRELDLSFNQISIMEGLNHLVNLEIIILCGNEIQKIVGIDDLHKLKIVSFANNKIDNWDHVMYLRNFTELRSLNVSGNPCMQENGFIDYVIAFIPQLLYFSYRMVTEEQRNKSREVYRLSIAKTEESETNLRHSLSKTKGLEEKKVRDFAAFVENLDEDEFSDLLFEKDEDNIIFKGINDMTKAPYEKYRAKINEISGEIYGFGNSKEVERAEELAMFQKTISYERNLVKSTARRSMNEIEERRNEILEELKSKLSGDNSKNYFENESHDEVPDQEDTTMDIDQGEAEKITGEFRVFLSSTWTMLMYNEIILHEQMENVLESFKNNMSDATEKFVQFVKVRFSHMRRAEDDYREEIDRIIDSSMVNINLDEPTISVDVTQLLGNPEILNDILAAPHHRRLYIVNSREAIMIKRIESWLNDLMAKLEMNENSQHRSRILEISHFLQFQRESLENVFHILNLNIDKSLETDVAAALDE